MPVDRFLHPSLGDSEKIALLTDGEFRVWVAYQMAADDFGVLPMLAAKVQGSHRALAHRPAKLITRALERIIELQLASLFSDQGSPYIWTPTWQYYQKIRYPRREQTHYPAPPDADLVALDGTRTAPTRGLFATFHMRVSDAFRRQFGDAETIAKIAEREQKRSGPKPRRCSDIPGMEPEHSGPVATLTRARAPETANGIRLTANGQRLSATGSEGGPGETHPPYDVWWLEAVQLYPEARRHRSVRAEQGFFTQLQAHPDGPFKAWDLFRANLAANVVSHEWQIRDMVPSLEKYICEGRWLNVLPVAPTSQLVSEKTSRTLTSAAQFVAGGSDGSR